MGMKHNKTAAKMLLLLSVGILARPSSVARPAAGTLSQHATQDEIERAAIHQGRDPSASPKTRAEADVALRVAMKGSNLQAIVTAIHATADIATLEVLDEARALRATIRQDMRESKGIDLQKAVEPPTTSAADTALRKAIEASDLDVLMDAIHENKDTASREVLNAARALRDELREAKHAARGEHQTGPSKIKRKPGPPALFDPGQSKGLSKHAAVERLSDMFFNGVPSDNPAKVGLTIHCWDATEQLPQAPWAPGIYAWWSASTINWANHHTFGDAGIIIEPDTDSVLCSYPFDSGTMSGGCRSGRPENLSKVIAQSMFWKHMGYNEILINSTDFKANLPTSVAAFVFNLKGEGKAGITYYRYKAFLSHFNLSDMDVPLLKANFGSTAGSGSSGTAGVGTWRTQEKLYSDPYECRGAADLHEAFSAWMAGDCPPKLIGAKERGACNYNQNEVKRSLNEEAAGSDKCPPQKMPLFTDMTAHAREYLRVNSAAPEPGPPLWRKGRDFRVGANRRVPPAYESMRTLSQKEFDKELERHLKATPV